jgi:hypothetical protein
MIEISKDNTHVKDSWRVKTPFAIQENVRALRVFCKVKDATITTRSVRSLVDEWCAHNLLYHLGIARSRTADVDLDEAKWYTEAGYFILAAIYKVTYKYI